MKNIKEKHIRVLHIENDSDDRRLVHEILMNHGFHVSDASTGIEGIAKTFALFPQIILLNMELPDMDGYEVILKIRGDERGTDVPIIAMGSKADYKMIQAVGGDGIIEKPINISMLPKQVLQFSKERHISIVSQNSDTRAEESGLLLLQGHKIAGKLTDKIEELERANRAILQAEKVRSDFYRNISHELSTPLTPAVGYLNMLLNEDLGELTPLQVKAVSSISRGVNKVRGLVENLLDVTALSTGKMSFFSRDYDFNLQAREALKLCSDQFKDRGIEVDFSIPKEPFEGYGDSDKLKRAMVQLLENAVKFCKPDGRVFISTRYAVDRFLFLVYDSGAGIPEQELSAIFKTFYQIDGSPTREHGGTGLGLALARKIIERFGGDIWAESPPTSYVTGFEWAKTMVGLWVPIRVSSS